MYKIGEFSKITNLSVKALHYYDEQGILKPSHRGENNYRLYDQSDFKKAQLIFVLRRFEFSIAETKEVLARYSDEADLRSFLLEKKLFIEEQIKKEKETIKAIDRHLAAIMNVEGSCMNYKFEIKEIAAIKVASIRYQDTYSNVGKYIGMIYKEVKNKACGAPFNCYYDGEYKEIADIETCVPIRGNVNSEGIVIKELPQIKALCTTHIGSYETLNIAYKAISDYANEHELELDLPSREIYYKGPGMIFKGNPDKYETEIVVPILQK